MWPYSARALSGEFGSVYIGFAELPRADCLGICLRHAMVGGTSFPRCLGRLFAHGSETLGINASIVLRSETWLRTACSPSRESVCVQSGLVCGAGALFWELSPSRYDLMDACRRGMRPRVLMLSEEDVLAGYSCCLRVLMLPEGTHAADVLARFPVEVCAVRDSCCVRKTSVHC